MNGFLAVHSQPTCPLFTRPGVVEPAVVHRLHLENTLRSGGDLRERRQIRCRKYLPLDEVARVLAGHVRVGDGLQRQHAVLVQPGAAAGEELPVQVDLLS